MAFAGAVAAAAVGVLHARVLYSVDVCPACVRAVCTPWPCGHRRNASTCWATGWGGWAGKYGCEFSEDLVNGQFVIAPLPEAFRPGLRPTALPVQFVP